MKKLWLLPVKVTRKEKYILTTSSSFTNLFELYTLWVDYRDEENTPKEIHPIVGKEYRFTEEYLKENLKDNVALLPEKIVVKDKKLINNNVLNSINPVAAPEDMIEVYDKKVQEDVKNEDKEVIEEVNNEIPVEVVEETKPVEMITLFIDDENLEVYSKFYTDKVGEKVVFDYGLYFPEFSTISRI